MQSEQQWSTSQPVQSDWTSTDLLSRRTRHAASSRSIAIPVGPVTRQSTQQLPHIERHEDNRHYAMICSCMAHVVLEALRDETASEFKPLCGGQASQARSQKWSRECSKDRVRNKEPLIPTPLPWQKVGTGLFIRNGTTYLLVIDYFSRFRR